MLKQVSPVYVVVPDFARLETLNQPSGIASAPPEWRCPPHPPSRVLPGVSDVGAGLKPSTVKSFPTAEAEFPRSLMAAVLPGPAGAPGQTVPSLSKHKPPSRRRRTGAERPVLVHEITGLWNTGDPQTLFSTQDILILTQILGKRARIFRLWVPKESRRGQNTAMESHML